MFTQFLKTFVSIQMAGEGSDMCQTKSIEMGGEKVEKQKQQTHQR